jgi:hypothetical protein
VRVLFAQVLLDKTRSFVSAWAAHPSGALIDDVNDWLTCMTADAVTKAAMGLVSACSCPWMRAWHCMCVLTVIVPVSMHAHAAAPP